MVHVYGMYIIFTYIYKYKATIHVSVYIPCQYMGVSKNSGIPKWMVYNGKPYQMDDLGVPLFSETPTWILWGFTHLSEPFFRSKTHFSTGPQKPRFRKLRPVRGPSLEIDAGLVRWDDETGWVGVGGKFPPKMFMWFLLIRFGENYYLFGVKLGEILNKNDGLFLFTYLFDFIQK